MRCTALLIVIGLSAGTAGFADAQPAGTGLPAEQASECPPDIKGDPPTIGKGSSEALSDKLAQSKGIICPPGGIDPEMQVTPPAGGRLKIIPPPGAPGGDPSVQPK